MRLRGVAVGDLLVTLVLGIFGCGPSGGPATSPSPSLEPGQTQAPEILEAEIVGVRVLSSGDAVQPNQDVVFTGRGPANVQIRVYQEGSLLDTTSTSATGEFTFTWNSGSTEGTFLLEFAAKDPELAESLRVPSAWWSTAPHLSCLASPPGPVLLLMVSHPGLLWSSANPLW